MEMVILNLGIIDVFLKAHEYESATKECVAWEKRARKIMLEHQCITEGSKIISRV